MNVTLPSDLLNQTAHLLQEVIPIQLLMVDDEADFLEASKSCLAEYGSYDIDTATTVTDALQLLRQKK